MLLFLVLALVVCQLAFSKNTILIRIAGLLFLLGGFLKGFDATIHTFPQEAEAALYELPTILQSFSTEIKSLSNSINYIAGGEVHPTTSYLNDFTSLDDFTSRWRNSVPNLAHDFLDPHFISALLAVTIGCLFLKMASIEEWKSSLIGFETPSASNQEPLPDSEEISGTYTGYDGYPPPTPEELNRGRGLMNAFLKWFLRI